MSAWKGTRSLHLPTIWAASLTERCIVLQYELFTEWIDESNQSRLLLIHDNRDTSHTNAGRYRLLRMISNGRVDEIAHAVLGPDAECTVDALGAALHWLGSPHRHMFARSYAFVRCIDRVKYRLQQKSTYPLLHCSRKPRDA